jgi:bile acid:Na+ symporter, BASS family
MSLQALILLVLRISIVLSVFALGLGARFADTLYLFRQPGRLARAFLSMNVLMPLAALLLVYRFDLHPAVKIALVALSVSPVPPIFPKSALQEGGKENYTIGLLVATSVLAIAVIPLAMEIFEKIGGTPMSMPATSVAAIVFAMVLLPLFLGIAARKTVWAQPAAKHVGTVASMLLVLGVLPVLFVESRTIFSLIGNGTLLSLAAFAVAGLIAGYWLGGPQAADRVLSVATASRHPGLAVAIAHANFPQQKMAVPAVCLYLIVSGFLALLLRRFRAQRELMRLAPTGAP